MHLCSVREKSVHKSAIFKAMLSGLKSPFTPERRREKATIHLISQFTGKINLHWLNYCVPEESVVDYDQTQTDSAFYMQSTKQFQREEEAMEFYSL